MRASTGRRYCLGLASNARLDITGIVPVTMEAFRGQVRGPASFSLPCISDLDLEIWIWVFEPSAIFV